MHAHLHARRRTLLALLAAVAIAWFALLGARDLIEPDEGRYAEVPREMVVSGDWITPHLNGFNYFEKPPLQYWLTALGFEAFGLGNGVARLWPALLGFAGAAAAGLLAARLYGAKAGLAAFLVLPSSLLYFVLGHALTLDMAVSTFLLLGLCALVMAQRERGTPASARWMWAGWAALAAATLTKGLIGIVLPGAAVLLYSLWQRDWALWRHLRLGSGLLIVLALTAPWFVAVSLRNPDFAWFFFVREHLLRFTTTVHHRYEPAWFFVPVLLVGTVPWTGPYLRALVRPGFAWRPQAGQGFSAERLLWVFAVTVFVVFSLSDSKLAPYILPMFAPLAILAAPRLARHGDRSVLPVAGLAAAGLIALELWADSTPRALFPFEVLERYADWLYVAALLLALAGLASQWLRAGRPLRLGATALLAMLALQATLWAVRAGEPGHSSRALAEAIRADGPTDAEIYCVGSYYPQSLPFYAQRVCDPVGLTDELEKGIRDAPYRWFGSYSDWATHWYLERSAYAVIDKATFQALRGMSLPMRVVYEGPRLVVVSRH